MNVRMLKGMYVYMCVDVAMYDVCRYAETYVCLKI